MSSLSTARLRRAAALGALGASIALACAPTSALARAASFGAVTLTPTPANYQTVTVGATEIKTFTLTNTDTTANDLTVTVGDVSLVGEDPSQFSITSDTCSGASLASGASCTVSVAFAPNANGVQIDDVSLTIPSNATNGSVSAALSGTGATPAAISVVPDSDSFGSVAIGDSTTKTFTVYDTGGQSLSVGQASVSDSSGQFTLPADQDACSHQTVIAGGNCTLKVQFAPSTTGAQSATLSVPSSTGTATVALTASTGNSVTSPGNFTGREVSTIALRGQTKGPKLCARCADAHLTLRLTLAYRAQVALLVERKTASGWRRVASKRMQLSHGQHKLRISSPFAGKRLTAGRYRLLLTATSAGKKSSATELFSVTAP